MTVRFTDLNYDPPRAYVAKSIGECRGVDSHAFAMVELTGEAVTMGNVIAEPILEEPPSRNG